MEDKFVEDMNASPGDLLCRMKFIGKQVQNDEGPVFRILSVFFESKPFNVSLARFIFESDFLNCINEKNLTFILKLIENKASVLCFWIILSAFDERADEFDDFCEVFSKYFFSGIDIEDIYTCYQSCMTPKEMNERLLLLEKQMKEKESMEFQEKQETDFADENCTLKRQVADLNQDLSNLRMSLETAYKKIMLYKREVWKNKVEAAHIKEASGKNNTFIRMVEEKNRQLIQRVEFLECINRNLQKDIEGHIARTATEQQKYRVLQQRYSDKESENTGLLFELEQLRNTIAQLENDTKNNLYDAVPDKNLEVENLGENLEVEELSKDMDDLSRENDEDVILYDESNLTYISDGMETLTQKSSLFAQFFSKFHEKKFKKKPQLEQENIIFIKMMELKLAQEKVLIIKKLLRNNDQFSRLDLYKLIAKNPSGEELEEFCNMVSAA